MAPSVVFAQGSDEWRSRFAAGEQALLEEVFTAYATEMAAAVRAMPDRHLNRPFAQYHAARAAALVGRTDEAVAWLRQAWDEDIESLMISFARYDPAFEDIRDSEGFRGVMALSAAMDLKVRPLSGSVSRELGVLIDPWTARATLGCL